jgi:hypothetical protein
MTLVRLGKWQGHRDEARAALAADFNTGTEGFTTSDRADTPALLERLT